MDIGEIPDKKDKQPAIPLNLYYVEYTSYCKHHKEHFHLEKSNLVKLAVFEKNLCDTTNIHYVAEFTPLKNKQKHDPNDGYMVVYLMYNEPGYFFAHTPDPKQAFKLAQENVHPSIEKIILNRYRFKRDWTNVNNQPYVPQLNNFKPELYNQI